MSVTSSTCSTRAAPADIIDLDRYIRSVRDHPPGHKHKRRQLVVDEGGCGRAGAGSSTSDSRAGAGRYSHDSGLSDPSYGRRRHRRSTRETPARTKQEASGKKSSSSLRAFRAEYLRALRSQQQQIERVTTLCTALAARPERSERKERNEWKERNERSVSSDISSTSCSVSRQFRADECRTYKIIMSKLDELNRLFTARRAANPAGPPAAPPAAPAAPPSAVSVSDKVVGTEAPCKTIAPSVMCRRRATAAARSQQPGAARLVERAVGDEASRGAGSVVNSQWTRRSARGDAANNLIPPGSVFCETIEDPASCDFDLNNPLHLYAQAKRLETVSPVGPASRERARAPPSLCAWCRGQLRAVRHYLAAQLLCGPPHSC